MPAIIPLFGFLAANAGVIGTAAVIGGTAAVMASNSAHQATKEANAANDARQALIGTPGTTVDPSTQSNTNQLGSAALVSTSPLGVQGTDPSQRYKLLGN